MSNPASRPRKKLYVLSVRLTRPEQALLRTLARRAGCSESVLVRELVHREARVAGLLSPLGMPADLPSREAA